MTDTITDVEMRSVDSLIPYTNNPKEHPDGQVQKIASSIKNYGWDQPIVVDGEGEIIKGHGRMQAARLLGLNDVPVIERRDLTEAEARAARIADNKTAESGWLDEELSLEVQSLEDGPIDLDSLGFDDNELDSILQDVTTDDEDIAEAFEQLPDEERSEIRQRTFTLSESQLHTVEDAIEDAKSADLPPSPNDNENGNALAHVCREYLD